jgi:hypothetical protein
MMRAVLATLMLALVTMPALGHDWYPSRCCGGGPRGDCAMLAKERVRETATGHLIDGRYHKSQSETERSPDGAYHACFPKHLNGRPGCFFAPPPGS